MSELSAYILPPALVTVVIPCFNKQDTVARAIESVKKQSLNNLECFIVDDGSTDGSKQVILDAIRDDARFHYIYQENAGVAHARNRGVFAGNAPYVCCLDSDDWIEEKFLEVCVAELMTDPPLGIAYTGLWYMKPDGSEGLSPWPGNFDYNAQVEGRNQIPTCNVAKREIWERLGGQRQRYAPEGAGEEDAEMWLRAGSIGFSAKKVTDAGLFRYAWLSGGVSGSTDHMITDWRAWHPWTKDKQHPFASVAKPNRRFSHPVREYDQPAVSVIIPVGKGHEQEVINALDSLEAQTLRNWEVVMVDDTEDFPNLEWQSWILKAYPYVRMVTAEKKGAGFARNVGAKHARAPLLLFLDADDWFHPEALGKMLGAWDSERSIVYSDYIGKVIADETAIRKSYGERVLFYNKKISEASIYFKSADYDCEKAIRQPYPEKGGFPYVWCLISALVPKVWHDEIGGFDEAMESWEDWDYWIRMAKAGKCFVRIPEGLIAYRFSSGSRRDTGLQAADDLIQYLQAKYEYEGVNVMPCNCKEKTIKPSPPPVPAAAQTFSESKVNNMTDSNMVLVEYLSMNRGDHRVTGPSTNINYGYRQGGSQFLVHIDDVRGAPHLFREIKTVQTPAVPEAKTTPLPPPIQIAPPAQVEVEIENVRKGEPTKIDDEEVELIQSAMEAEDYVEVEKVREDDLQTIPGITNIIMQSLNAAGVHSFQDLLDFGADNLTKIKGIGDKKAEMILDFAGKKVRGEL